MDINGSDEVIADGQGTQAANEAESEKIDRSPLGAQGVQRSSAQNARRQQDARQGSRKSVRGQFPQEEQTAEDEGILGG